LGYSFNLQIKLPNVNNHPIGENSPNPVTLYVGGRRRKECQPFADGYKCQQKLNFQDWKKQPKEKVKICQQIYQDSFIRNLQNNL
jgi:hypothetical protein